MRSPPVTNHTNTILSRQAMGAAFANYAPHFTGPITPEDSVNKIMDVVSSTIIVWLAVQELINHR